MKLDALGLILQLLTAIHDSTETRKYACGLLQKLLERLEKSKPLVATAAQYRQDFVEHERRLMLCSYSCRRKKVDNLRSLKPDQKAEEQHRIENDARRRQCAEQELRHKVRCSVWRLDAHISIDPQTVHQVVI